MSELSGLGLRAAAQRYGVPLRLLRQAMRAGVIPAPPRLTATDLLPVEWVAQVDAAIEASPKAFSRAKAQRVPPFARYEGTSAWRKYRRRAHEYSVYQASGA